MALTRLKSYAGSAASIMKGLSRPIETLTASILGSKGISLTVAVEDSLIKDAINHQFASLSSMVSTFNIVSSGGEFFCNLYDDWNQLTTNQQRGVLVSLAIFSTVTGLYPLLVLGLESHTVLAGLSATTSVGTSISANELLRFFVKKNNNYSTLDQEAAATYTATADSPPVLRS